MSRIFEPEEQRDEAVVHAADDAPQHAVGAAQLVALHDVDVVGRVLHEQLELGGVVLRVTVGVEDPLPAGGGESRQQHRPVARSSARA